MIDTFTYHLVVPILPLLSDISSKLFRNLRRSEPAMPQKHAGLERSPPIQHRDGLELLAVSFAFSSAFVFSTEDAFLQL